MPKAFPDGQSSICKRGLWETILTHHYQNTTPRLQPLTAAASSSSYEASGIPEMKPVKMTWQGGPMLGLTRTQKGLAPDGTSWWKSHRRTSWQQRQQKKEIEYYLITVYILYICYSRRKQMSQMSETQDLPNNGVYAVYLLQSQKT